MRYLQSKVAVLVTGLVVIPVLSIIAPAARAQTPTVLLSELAVAPTGSEFVEIYNPTGVTIDLSGYHLTDATYAAGGTYYYNIVVGTNAGGGGFSDFLARFPSGASIDPSEAQTVALSGSDDFFTTYGVDPTYELYEDGATPDAIPDMEEALPGSINNQGSLSNSGEVVVLFVWDGVSDLVADIDYALWGDKDEAVDKSGVTTDGPDPDANSSGYLPDTEISSQDVIALGEHAFGSSFQRIDLSEGGETPVGGNGLNGHDETSEDLSNTWGDLAPTPNAGIWVFSDGFEAGNTSAWSNTAR